MTLKRRPVRKHCTKGCRCLDGLSDEINYDFASGDVERMRVYAKEAFASGPDLILAQTNPALEAVRNATRSLPIIFLQVSDPVGGGFVESLAHPGGNITGFTNCLR